MDLEVRRFMAINRLKPAAFDYLKGVINAAISHQETFVFSSNFTVPSEFDTRPKLRADDLFTSGFDSGQPCSMDFGSNPEHNSSGMFGLPLPLYTKMHVLRPKLALNEQQ